MRVGVILRLVSFTTLQHIILFYNLWLNDWLTRVFNRYVKIVWTDILIDIRERKGCVVFCGDCETNGRCCSFQCQQWRVTLLLVIWCHLETIDKVNRTSVHSNAQPFWIYFFKPMALGFRRGKWLLFRISVYYFIIYILCGSTSFKLSNSPCILPHFLTTPI